MAANVRGVTPGYPVRRSAAEQPAGVRSAKDCFQPPKAKRSVVEEGLRLVARLDRQRRVRSLRGKLRWEGDLETMRRDHGSR